MFCQIQDSEFIQIKHTLTTWPLKFFPFRSTTVLIAASTLSNSKYVHTASSTGPSGISNITHFPTLPYFSHSSLVSTSKSSSTSPAPILFLSQITLVGHKYFSCCCCLCNTIDGSPPGSPIPGILQASILASGFQFNFLAASFSLAWPTMIAAPLTSLLHRRRCAQTLLLLPDTLAFPKVLLLHEFMYYPAPDLGEERVAKTGHWGSKSVLFLVHCGRGRNFGRL